MNSNFRTSPISPRALSAWRFTLHIMPIARLTHVICINGIHGAHFSVKTIITNLSEIAASPNNRGKSIYVLIRIALLRERLTAAASSWILTSAGNNTDCIVLSILLHKRLGIPSPRLKYARSALEYFMPRA